MRDADAYSLLPLRDQFVPQGDLDEAADAFVKAMGWGNADRLSANLRHVLPASDALKALNAALVRNFNINRQEQIRLSNAQRRQT